MTVAHVLCSGGKAHLPYPVNYESATQAVVIISPCK